MVSIIVVCNELEKEDVQDIVGLLERDNASVTLMKQSGFSETDLVADIIITVVASVSLSLLYDVLKYSILLLIKKYKMKTNKLLKKETTIQIEYDGQKRKVLIDADLSEAHIERIINNVLAKL